MHAVRWGRRFAACSLALVAGTWGGASGAERSAYGAPRVAVVDTTAHGAVLALHGSAPTGSLLVACQQRVLEFTASARTLTERGKVLAKGAHSAGFFEVPGREQPLVWFLETGFQGGLVVQTLGGESVFRFEGAPLLHRVDIAIDPRSKEPRFLVQPLWDEDFDVLDAAGKSLASVPRGNGVDGALIVRSGELHLATTDGAKLRIVPLSAATDPARAVELPLPGAGLYLNSCDSLHEPSGARIEDRVGYGGYDNASKVQRWFVHEFGTTAAREVPEREYARLAAPARHASHGKLQLVGATLMRQAEVAGFSGASVEIHAVDSGGGPGWSDAFETDTKRTGLSRTTGAIRIVEVEGKALAVLGHGAGLALYELGPVDR